MFGVTGAGLSKIRHMQNGGKRARHSVDQWDRVSRTLADCTTAHDTVMLTLDVAKYLFRLRYCPEWILT
jgi:hypothetical protein